VSAFSLGVASTVCRLTTSTVSLSFSWSVCSSLSSAVSWSSHGKSIVVSALVCPGTCLRALLVLSVPVSRPLVSPVPCERVMTLTPSSGWFGELRVTCSAKLIACPGWFSARSPYLGLLVLSYSHRLRLVSSRITVCKLNYGRIRATLRMNCRPRQNRFV